MIKHDANLELKVIPLSELSVWEYQVRYPERLMHYIRLLQSNTTDWLGIIFVQPRAGRYEIVDGHHRYMAYIAMGRPDALCLVIH